MPYFSSRGPLFDGRLAPHVVAPGVMVASAYADDNPNTTQCGIGMRNGYIHVHNEVQI